MDEKLKQFRAEGKALKPFTSVGKQGLTDSFIAQVTNYLKTHKICKIKLNKSFLESVDKKEASRLIAEKTNSTVVDRVGFVIVLVSSKRL